MEPSGPLVMDAQTFLQSAGGGTANFVTETVHFVFSGIAQLTFVTDYDGWISGWQNSRNTGLGISLDVDNPSAVIATQGVYRSYILPLQNTAFAVEQNVIGDVRFPFKNGSKINVRLIVASVASVSIFLCRSI